MASLGWLLNLGFAAGSTSAPVGPFVGSLLLLGVGRMWWLPVAWAALTGRAYAGEVDLIMELVEPISYVVSGGLFAYGLIALRNWLRTKRRRAALLELERLRHAATDRSPKIASTIEGSAEPAVCLNCGKSVHTYLVLTDGTPRCKGCC